MRVERLSDTVTLYLGDCREILPTLPKVDAVVTDPPYGLGDKWQGGNAASKGKWKLSDGGAEMSWDMKPVGNLPQVLACADHAIIWGGQYYELPPARGWLIWDKIVRNFSTGHCEMAWTTLSQPVRAFNYSHGELATEGKLHPTQKPLPLMRWCLEQLPDRCRTILDPFMGAGTTGVACVDLGMEFIGIEYHGRYFDIACRRISDELKRPRLPLVERKPAIQEAML